MNSSLNTSKFDGFDVEVVETVEVLDAGDNAMNFIIGFATGIGIVMIAT